MRRDTWWSNIMAIFGGMVTLNTSLPLFSSRAAAHELSTFNYACYNESLPQPPVPNPNNFSIFDPCFWSYCGAGDCVKTRGFKHRCECRKGFGNILNFTSFPSVKDCAVGADCADLGFLLSNESLPPSPTNFGNSGAQGSSSQINLSWLFICATSLAVTQAKWMKL